MWDNERPRGRARTVTEGEFDAVKREKDRERDRESDRESERQRDRQRVSKDKDGSAATPKTPSEAHHHRLTSFMEDPDILHLLNSPSFSASPSATCVMCNTAAQCPLHSLHMHFTPQMQRQSQSRYSGSSGATAAATATNAGTPGLDRRSIDGAGSIFLSPVAPPSAPATLQTSSAKIATRKSMSMLPSTFSIPFLASSSSSSKRPVVSRRSATSASGDEDRDARMQSVDSNYTLQSHTTIHTESSTGEDSGDGDSAIPVDGTGTELSPRNKRVQLLVNKLEDLKTRFDLQQLQHSQGGGSSASKSRLIKKFASQVILMCYYLKECIEERPASQQYLCEETKYCEVIISIVHVFLKSENYTCADDMIDIFKFILLSMSCRACVKQLVAGGLCEILVEAISSQMSKIPLLIQLLQVLKTITQDNRETTQMKLAYLGMCQLLITAMRVHQSQVEVVILACTCVGNIALDFNDRKRHGSEVICSSIINLLLNPPNVSYSNLDMVEEAFAVWMEMITNLSHRFDLDGIICIEFYIEIMRLHSQSPMIVSYLCHEIKNKVILSDDTANFGTFPLCEAIKEVIICYSYPSINYEDVLDQLLQIVHYMVRYSKSQQAFTEGKLAEVLVHVINTCIGDASYDGPVNVNKRDLDDLFVPVLPVIPHHCLSILHFLFEQQGSVVNFLASHGCRAVWSYFHRLASINKLKHLIQLAADAPTTTENLSSFGNAENDVIPCENLVPFCSTMSTVPLLSPPTTPPRNMAATDSAYLMATPASMAESTTAVLSALDALQIKTEEMVKLVQVIFLQLVGRKFERDEEYDQVSNEFDLLLILATLLTKSIFHSEIFHVITDDISHIVRWPIGISNEEDTFSMMLSASSSRPCLVRICIDAMRSYRRDRALVKSICHLIPNLLQMEKQAKILTNKDIEFANASFMEFFDESQRLGDEELSLELKSSLQMLLPPCVDNHETNPPRPINADAFFRVTKNQMAENLGLIAHLTYIPADVENNILRRYEQSQQDQLVGMRVYAKMMKKKKLKAKYNPKRLVGKGDRKGNGYFKIINGVCVRPDVEGDVPNPIPEEIDSDSEGDAL